MAYLSLSWVVLLLRIKYFSILTQDDVDIRFSRTLNNCKVPQIRYATPERLLQRLTDLRFLSIDFLNTFLLTYRVFAEGVQVGVMSHHNKNPNSVLSVLLYTKLNLIYSVLRLWDKFSG